MPTLPPTKRRPWQPPAPKRVYQLHSERTALYDSPQWRRLRASQLARRPCCEECQRQDRLTPATVADHVVPYRDGAAFFDASNLQSLCASCHAKKSAKEGRERARSAASAPQP